MSLSSFKKNGWKSRPICPWCEKDIGIGNVGTYLYDYCKHCRNRIIVVKQQLTIYKLERDELKG